MEAAVSYGESVAKALVGKLGQLLSDEYRQLRGVRGEVVQLKDEVAIMNALLRMLAEADDSAVNHFVREWMKQVREVTYDAEDCIDLFVRRISCVPKGAGALGAARHLFVTLRARHRLAVDIHDLRTRALAISDRRARYGVDSQALRPSAYFAPIAMVTSSAVELVAAHDPNKFVGIGGQVEILCDKLKPQDNEADNKPKVISIVGFGGLGKTTLAMQVCRRTVEQFACQATVSVSQAFDATKDMRDLLKQLLQQVVKVKMNNQKGIQQEATVGNVDSMTLAELAGKLDNHLKDKRYLIVVDDVWTTAAWDAIRPKLPENNLNSRIIVTTRIEGVAKACSPPIAGENQNIHKIHPLKPQDSEKLFVDRVFGLDATCPDELKKQMSIILNKCGGLPLAIVSIASLLVSYRSPRSIEMWERICNSMGSQLEINPTLEGMRQVITLSYNHLPHHLKTCIMYLGIFPEDYVIRKKRILYRWVAEGFIMEKRGLTLLEVAEAYFDELMSRSMINPTNIRYDGATRACQVHDMMLEVILSKSLEENFVTLVGGQCGGTPHDSVRRLSIQGDDLRHAMEGMDVKHIRSLSTFRDGHQKLLDRLAEFTLLRVLDLEGCNDFEDKHMKNICGLFLLRFLSLRYTNVRVIPSQIEKLRHLQTLDLHGTAIQELPQSVTNLEKLEHLYFTNKHNCYTLWRLPKGLEKMKSLRLARKVDLINDRQVAREIGNLTQLRDIEFVLCCNDKQVLEEFAVSLSRLQSLRTLKVADRGDYTRKLNCLLDIPEAPPLLQSLRISGIIDKMPGWIESLKHLATIKFGYLHLHGDQIFSVLHKLPNLMRIDIMARTCKDRELVARTTYKFRTLKELIVSPEPDCNLVVIRFEKGSMEKLEKLMMRFSNVSREIQGLEHLTSLKEVKLIGDEGNQALHRTVGEVKAKSEKRPELDQINVIVQY